jgi:hypothetical protein
MYASKIKIDYNPMKIRYHREVELPEGLLNISDISKHLQEGEEFRFREVETSQFGNTLYMDILGDRLETQQELSERILKQEKYNENYEIFHTKYDKVKNE